MRGAWVCHREPRAVLQSSSGRQRGQRGRRRPASPGPGRFPSPAPGLSAFPSSRSENRIDREGFSRRPRTLEVIDVVVSVSSGNSGSSENGRADPSCERVVEGMEEGGVNLRQEWGDMPSCAFGTRASAAPRHVRCCLRRREARGRPALQGGGSLVRREGREQGVVA